MALRDLKLDPDTHDLVLEDFDLALVEGLARVRQQLAIRLQFFRGEWFLDLDFGVPWFQEVLGVKPPPVSHAELLIRDQVLSTPDVEELEELGVDYVGESRALTVELRAKTNFGDVDLTTEVPA